MMHVIAYELTCSKNQPDRDQVWKFKKVTQRSTSNSFKILVYRILLSSYNLIQAIYEELSCSQSLRAIYCIHRVPDAARHLSACWPRQRQYTSSLRGLRGKNVSCFQTSRPFFEAFLRVWSTRTDEISSRWSTNCNERPKTVDHVW